MNNPNEEIKVPIILVDEKLDSEVSALMPEPKIQKRERKAREIVVMLYLRERRAREEFRNLPYEKSRLIAYRRLSSARKQAQAILRGEG